MEYKFLSNIKERHTGSEEGGIFHGKGWSLGN